MQIKGWMWKGSKCYWVWKQVEPFCNHLSNHESKYTTLTQNLSGKINLSIKQNYKPNKTTNPWHRVYTSLLQGNQVDGYNLFKVHLNLYNVKIRISWWVYFWRVNDN